MEKYVFLNLWSLRVIGVWYPDKSSPFMVKVYSILRSLTVLSVLFIVIPAAIAAQDHFRQNDISSGVEILTLLISSTVVLCKSVDIVLRRNQVRILVKQMSGFWQRTNSDDLKTMKKFAVVGKWVTKFYITLGFLNVISYTGQPFLNSYLYNADKNSTNVIFDQLPFQGWENFMAHSESAILVALVFALHVIAGIFACVASIGYDCFFVVLILHVCANLRVTANKLREFQSLKDNEIGAKITSCAEMFQSLIAYTKELENMLSLFLLAQSLSSTFVICLTSFLVSRDIRANKEFFKYLSYWSGALFQLFIFCWAANDLQTEANMVGQSAYEAYGKLVNLDLKNDGRHRHLLTKIPRYLQMILLRSQSPLKITAGNFYAMSLENYKKILSTSYSYFTILRAFADK